MAAAKPKTAPTKGASGGQVFSAGAFLGFATGYATKKLGKLALFATGVGVLALQYLAHKGVIEVDWTKIGDAIEGGLDVDGDGKLTTKDVTAELKAIVNFASYRLPFAGAFSVGFYAGIRYG